MMRAIFGNRRSSQVAFLFIFLLIMTLVRGIIFGADSKAGLFVAPVIAGVATVALSYWIRARMTRE
ncbi:MAG: hypothetical protein QOJ00_271 [Actinomycetota bacterium]|jgi:hypothetical protein